VTSSTKGIATPSAFALEYTSLAVDPLAIKRSPSKATYRPKYFSRFSCNHLSDFAEPVASACEPFLSPLDVPFSSSHQRILSCSGAGSCSIDLMIWSKLKLMSEFYHRHFSPVDLRKQEKQPIGRLHYCGKLLYKLRITWSRLPELNRRPSNYESDQREKSK